MKTCLLCCSSVLLFVAVGCKTAQSPTASPPATAAAVCPSGDVAGEWAGTGDGPAGHYIMSATIWQTGTNLRVMGRWDNTDQGMSQNHNFEGSLRCDDHTFALRSVGEAVNWDVSGSFGPDFASLKGSWTADGGGEFTFTKR